MNRYRPLPSKVDLRPGMPPIKDQGTIGSCTGQAASALAEYLQLIANQDLLPLTECPVEFQDNVFEPVSAMFLYYNARLLDGNTTEDEGSTLQQIIRTTKIYGIAREVSWPYHRDNLFRRPHPEAYSEAKAHRLPHGYAITGGLLHLKTCLANGYPFVFGAMLFDSFMSERTARTGVVPMPGSQEGFQGGHAMSCFGYDDARQAFLVRNSWGRSWGLDGMCWFPYNYMGNYQLVSDLWTLRPNKMEE